ncbi:hypothetical protein PB01_10235 [Psychrobacillus glaciei]|uniref:Phage capsid protein n=1 Tax=Psychrobacillus glaciei TaxID=2283160 RepID=A0A5J6SSJ5_9BACI|nr:DUF6366 family protein [Psychrobacillus glaciei]QFF99177.1 hypothetical protein PB01_10235 [Psychrobacillus glaciei]
MNTDKETPENRRERLRLEELKRNPIGNLNDAFNRASSGSFMDMGWKSTGLLILVLIVGFIIVSIFFK